VAFPQSGSSSNWNIEVLIFVEVRKNQRTHRKTLEGRERTNKQLYSHA
jgi:hypothetical protein